MENESIFAHLDIRDADEAFDNAIKKGMKRPEEWMYMYTDHGRDYFKHDRTRGYISYRRAEYPVIYDFLRRVEELAKYVFDFL